MDLRGDVIAGPVAESQRIESLDVLRGGVWAFELAFAPLWLRSFRFGPFEWLWRSLTYMRRQPFRRGAAGL